MSPDFKIVSGDSKPVLVGLRRLFHEDLRFRTKLLLSFVLLSAGLTCATLVAVRGTFDSHARRRLAGEARNGAMMFQVVLQQEQTALNRKADLLASLAYIRNGDPTAIQDPGDDPWASEDCNLYALADMNGKVTAVRSANPLPLNAADEMLSRSIERKEISGWWINGRDLYQVAVQPFYDEGAKSKKLQGYVVVGRLIDRRVANLLATIGSSQVMFRYDGQPTVSSLPLVTETDAAKKIPRFLDAPEITFKGEPYYVTSVKLGSESDSGVELLVLKSYADVVAYQKKLNHLLFGIGLVAVLVGAVLIFIVCDTITRPLGFLVEGVQALERGDFTYPLKAAGQQDEVSRLTSAFDSMRGSLQRNELQRQQLEGQLHQAQKMDALGRLAGGVAHDFNNLLTVIRGHSELILDRLRPSDALYNNSEQIRKTADRATTLTRQLLAFSRKQVFQPKVVNANELIAEAGKLLRRLIREDIELRLQFGESLWDLKADPGQLEQVLMNLVVNASDAMPVGGNLTIETRNCMVDRNYAGNRPSIEPGQYVLLAVSDTGEGMDDITKSRIFEPFFTTKEPGKGTGLGLATVYGVVKQTGGFIWVESELGRGSRFELYFPRTSWQREPQVAETSRLAVNANRSKPTILVVEDEAQVRQLACEFLTAAGYSVLSSQNGMEALELADGYAQSIQAVLTDVIMPKMRGPELALQLEKLLPHVKIVYMTGYLDDSCQSLKPQSVLNKPFSRETLVRHVDQALEAIRREDPLAVAV